jgi:hypothetical protein
MNTTTQTANQPSSAFDSLKAKHDEVTKPKKAPVKRVQSYPQYMTKQQEFVLKMSQEAGWTIRSMVADTKLHKVAVAIEKDGEYAWITSEGQLKSESEVVKASGAV